MGPLNAASVAWRRQALLAQWERSCDLTTFGFAPRSQTVRKRTQSTFFVQSIDKKDQLLILFTCLEPVHRQTRGHHQPLDPPLRRAHARLRDHGDGRSPLLLCITRLHPLPFLLPELQVKSLQRLRLQSNRAVGVAAEPYPSRLRLAAYHLYHAAPCSAGPAGWTWWSVFSAPCTLTAASST